MVQRAGYTIFHSHSSDVERPLILGKSRRSGKTKEYANSARRAAPTSTEGVNSILYHGVAKEAW